jgi:hypothetical protein
VFHADVSLAAVVFGVCICVCRDVLCDDSDAAVSGVAAVWVRVRDVLLVVGSVGSLLSNQLKPEKQRKISALKHK